MAVIVVPDEKWREAVKAVVELNAGTSVRADALIEFCKPHLALKHPKSADFWDRLQSERKP